MEPEGGREEVAEGGFVGAFVADCEVSTDAVLVGRVDCEATSFDTLPAVEVATEGVDAGLFQGFVEGYMKI